MGSFFGGGGNKLESKLESDEYEGGDYKDGKKLKLPEHGGFDKFKGDLKNKIDSDLKKTFNKFDKDFKGEGKKTKPKQKEEYGEGYEEGYDEGYKSKGCKGKG